MLRDILQESWAFQDILREGLEVGIEQGLEQGIKQGQEKERQAELKRWRQKLLHSVEKRFPDVVPLLRKQVKAIDDPLVLEELMFELLPAKTAEEARQCLLTFGMQEKKD